MTDHRPMRGKNAWRQWYIAGHYDSHEFEAWLRSNVKSFGVEYDYRADPPWIATNLPLSTLRRHMSGAGVRLPVDYNSLTLDEVEELYGH